MARTARVIVLIATLLLGLSDAPSLAAPRTRLSIATQAPGTATFVLAGALARLISQKRANVEADLVEPAGPGPREIANLRMIGERRADLAFTPGGQARDALRGEGTFQGTTIPLRTLAPLFTTVHHLVTLGGTGINVVSDLRGKRVALGPGAPGTVPFIRGVLQAAGLDPARDLRVPEYQTLAAFIGSNAAVGGCLSGG